jgi:hypothetical protein
MSTLADYQPELHLQPPYFPVIVVLNSYELHTYQSVCVHSKIKIKI